MRKAMPNLLVSWTKSLRCEARQLNAPPIENRRVAVDRRSAYQRGEGAILAALFSKRLAVRALPVVKNAERNFDFDPPVFNGRS